MSQAVTVILDFTVVNPHEVLAPPVGVSTSAPL